ncbi:MAG: flagellar basal body-associated FliL family protein [Kofleriaceae bacterium]|nr:flagellar basal body-associated FliL family protein [Kofleriaceae bacterium]MBP6835822.1 flagellar basal body-associated FliL family protein [Kofleriaceae bacterium]MBP9206933.1 flagellar basal body-associated FliL family protein [Kofleriaceae bacterium]
MSDSEEPTEGAEAPATPPGPKPPKVVLGLLAVNLLATAFVAFKVATAKPAKAAGHGADGPPAVVMAKDEIKGPVVALDPFVVNLNESDQARYAKISIEVELGGKEAVRALEKGKQLVRDNVMTYLSGLRVADTLGSDNRRKIREDLIASITEVLGEGRVRRMFFTEFVVQ